MALHLSTSVRVLPGVGEETAKDLKALEILSLRDLLLHFPFRYDDYARIVPVANLRNDETATIVGTIRQIETRPSKKNPRLKLTEAVFEDESGTLKVMWFNQPYLEKTLRPGSKVSLAGRLETKMGRSMVNPVHEPAGAGVQLAASSPSTHSPVTSPLAGCVRL
jgi:ATP-dependent DNA helicase RecG